MTNKEIGNFGETAACDFLIKQGASVIKRNFHARAGEIDIIAKEGDTTLFVEVKTRSSKAFGVPSEFVNYKKQEKIRKTAVFFLGRDDIEMRFDVIEVMYKMAGDVPVVTEINHIKDAF